MRTNRSCPMYVEEASSGSRVDSQDHDGDYGQGGIQPSESIRVEGTRISIPKSILNQAENRRSSLTIRIPKSSQMNSSGGRSGSTGKRKFSDDWDEINPESLAAAKAAARRRKNPEIALAIELEKIWVRLKSVKDSWPFHKPVNAKLVPDYYDVIKEPRDFAMIGENIRSVHYKSSAEFLADVKLLADNCALYNGPSHPYTVTARDIQRLAEELVMEMVVENTGTTTVESQGGSQAQLEQGGSTNMDDELGSEPTSSAAAIEEDIL